MQRMAFSLRLLWLPIAVLFTGYLCLHFCIRELLNEHTAIQLWVTRITLLLLLVYASYNTSVQQINEFILESSSPLNLAVFRLAHFGWLLWPAITTGKNPGLNIVYPYVDYPVTARLPVPGNEWLSMLVPVSPDITGPAIWLYNISLVLSFLGVATQFSTKVYAILTLYLCFIPELYGKVNNLHHLVWFPMILAFSPCGHTLSVDRLVGQYLFRKKYEDAPLAVFSTPIKIAMLMLGLIYFFPGFWKLWNGGFDWIFTLNLTKQLYVKWSEMNGWLPIFRLDRYPSLVIFCSIITIGFELGFIFLCIRKICRPALLLTGIVLHSGIYLLMNISFFALLPNYVVLVDWARLFKISSITFNKPPSMIPHGKPLITVAIILLGGNIIYGLKKQQSYPFSCYPTFDYMVPDSMYFISYAGIKDGVVVLSHKEVKTRIFRHIPDYNLRALENRMLDASLTNDTILLHQTAESIFYVPNEYSEAEIIAILKIRQSIMPGADSIITTPQKLTEIDIVPPITR